MTNIPNLKNAYKNNRVNCNLPKESLDNLILTFDIYQIHEYEKEYVFFLVNTLDIQDNNKLIVIQISIPLEENRSEFGNKIVVAQGVNKYDRAGLNFGLFLHQILKWDTNQHYLRSLRLTTDKKHSINFLPEDILTKKQTIAVTDAAGQHVFKIEIDWNDKKAAFIISNSNIKTFKSVFFIKTDISNQRDEKPEVIEQVLVNNFDKDGEPELKLMNNGQILIHFNFMPPLNGGQEQSALPIFDNFDKELSKIIGKEVVWEDRELFIVRDGNKDDLEKLLEYLETFWTNKK